MLPRQLITRPVLTRNPQNYIGDSARIDQLMLATERALAAGDGAAVVPLLRALGVSHVIVRKDLDFESPIRRIEMVRPEPLLAGAALVPGVTLLHDGPTGTVWELPSDEFEPVQVIGGMLRADAVDDAGFASLVVGAPDGYALVGSDDPLVAGARRIVPVDVAGTEVRLDGDGTWTVERVADGPALHQVILRDTGDGLQEVLVRDAVVPTIDGAPLAEDVPTVVGRTRAVVGLMLDGQYRPFDSDVITVRLGAGSTAQVVSRADTQLLQGAGTVGNCNRYDDRTNEQVGISAAEVGDAETRVLELRADDHAACVQAPVAVEPGMFGVQVDGDLTSVSGAPARICLWLEGPDRCAELPASAPDAEGWARLSGPVCSPPT